MFFLLSLNYNWDPWRRPQRVFKWNILVKSHKCFRNYQSPLSLCLLVVNTLLVGAQESLDSAMFHHAHFPQVLQKLWTITLALKKPVSLFTSQDDRSRTDDGFRDSSTPPFIQLRKLQALRSSSAVTSLHQTFTHTHTHTECCNRLHMHPASSIPSSPPHMIRSPLPEWCGVTRTGKHLPRRRKHTHALMRPHA